ncbi:MAG TPA: FtsX-like permease family protein [Terriglobales bacterium]
MTRRIVLRSLRLRRGRTAIALGALTIAATLITVMFALYSDLEQKLDKEFRSYGANIVVAATNGNSIPDDSVARIHDLLGHSAVIAPSALTVATSNSGPVVVVGIDVDPIKQIDSWWKVSSWPDEDGEALLGSRLPKRSKIDLTYAGKKQTFTSVGTVTTGGPEETRVFLPLDAFEKWTGLQPNLVEISYTGSAKETEAALKKLQDSFAGQPVEVRPVRQIVEAEGRVIRKTHAMMMACALLIAITVALCVGSTLTASVLERRRDFALMKALGASQSLINGIFTAEAAVLGFAAALIGFAAGAGVADLIGRINFHSSIVPAGVVFPSVIFATLAIALMSALLPLTRLQRLEPAVILKGD